MDFYNKIPFAISTDTGAVVSVDEVVRGLSCNCYCPSCNGRLKAIKGAKNIHHFAHYDKSSVLCKYSFETSIRAMLLSKLSVLQVINTPEYQNLQNEGRPVTHAQPGIKVRYVPQESYQNSPHGLFEVISRPEYQLGLVLPAVNEANNTRPPWLDGFVAEHHKTGILSVDYRRIGRFLSTEMRPDGIDTTAWLLAILSKEMDCLHWLYHPREQSRLESIRSSPSPTSPVDHSSIHKPAKRKSRLKNWVYEESARKYQAWLLEEQLKSEGGSACTSQEPFKI